MLFNSSVFLVFLAVVLPLHMMMRGRNRQNVLLLLASYVFYGAWDWRFLSLIVASTLIDYHAALRIERGPTAAGRRFWLVTSIAFNLGILGFFKYCDFSIESLDAILSSFGLEAGVPRLNLILPVGISFYTFQTMSYTIDVYRGRQRATTNLLDIAVYVAFFPQLVAGPIERSTHLLPQFERPRTVTIDDWRIGLSYVLCGYFLKVVIADNLAPLVDYAFANPTEVSGAVSVVSVWSFAIQIYGDFAGYSLIARGVARWMGIELVRNFDSPFLACNPREFWSRWHISLSTWLREYLYFGLGGNRRGKTRTYVNLMTTMLLGGLWHGARWNFVIWGAYHGVLLSICHAAGVSSRRRHGWSAGRLVGIFVTFVLMLVGWLLFRVDSTEHLVAVVSNMVGNFHLDASVTTYLVPTVTAFTLIVACDAWRDGAPDGPALLAVRPWPRTVLYAFMVICVWVTGFHPVPFVYFQF